MRCRSATKHYGTSATHWWQSAGRLIQRAPVTLVLVDCVRLGIICRKTDATTALIFDRAYVDFIHLGVLNDDGVFWVTRSKESLCFRVVKRLPKGADKRILSDELVVLEVRLLVNVTRERQASACLSLLFCTQRSRRSQRFLRILRDRVKLGTGRVRTTLIFPL